MAQYDRVSSMVWKETTVIAGSVAQDHSYGSLLRQ
jgi:hypothetical protein